LKSTQQEKRLKKAKEFRALYANKVLTTITDEAEANEYAELFQTWRSDNLYNVGEIIGYGVDANGAKQLYSVKKKHTSSADLAPGMSGSASFYKEIKK